MTRSPHRGADAAKGKALRDAAEAAHASRAALVKRDTAIANAIGAGASYREIADATGIPHMTVKRIVDREGRQPDSGRDRVRLQQVRAS